MLKRVLDPRRHLQNSHWRSWFTDQQRAFGIKTLGREERRQRARHIGGAHQRSHHGIAIRVVDFADDDAGFVEHNVAEVDDLAGRRRLGDHLVRRCVGAQASEHQVESARPHARHLKPAVICGLHFASDILRVEVRRIGEQVRGLRQDRIHRAAVDAHATVGDRCL